MGWVYYYLETVAFRNTYTFFCGRFRSHEREEGIERRGAPTTETPRKERRGEAGASPKSGVLRVLDEKVGVVTSTSIRA